MELQFWGYEVGNILAAIAGAGGFHLFHQSVRSAFVDGDRSPLGALLHLTSVHPDASVTLGLVCLVLVVPVLRARLLRLARVRRLNVLDATTTVAAVLLLGYSIALQASSVAIASACFVVGSCLLRQCRDNPLLLKAGGLALACGGIALAVFGLQLAWPFVGGETDRLFATGLLTSATGAYVLFASLLTYEGGIVETIRFGSRRSARADAVWMSRIAHPERGLLARRVFRHLDRPVLTFNARVSKPAIAWASGATKRDKPFKTSMLARLPWRVLTGSAALWSATPAGIVFFAANVCWAIGDVAIGSQDW